MNRQEELIKKVMARQASLPEMEELAELPVVEHRMKLQWEEHAHEPANDNRLGEKIWKRIRHRYRPARKPHRLRRMLWIGAAACLVCALAVGKWLLTGHHTEAAAPLQTEVAAETTRTVMLPDSTQVWLKPESKLSYYTDFGRQRQVWLQGEAVFDVKKRAENPFVVHLDHSFIEVKGTAFRAINRQATPLEITLFRGKVEFHTSDESFKIPMEPGQHLTFEPEAKRLEMDKLEGVEWKNGRFCFAGMKTGELIRTIGNIYHTRIELNDHRRLKNELFNGSIRIDETLPEVLEKICYNLNAGCRLRNDGSYLLTVK